MAAVTSPYFTAWGRGTAVRIDSFSVVRYGNFATSSLSSYRLVRVGACEVASRLDRSESSLVKNLMKSSAVALFSANEEIAKLWPPRVDTPGPDLPGSGATSNLSTIFDEPSVAVAFAYTYGQLRRKISSPSWKARLLGSSW